MGCCGNKCLPPTISSIASRLKLIMNEGNIKELSDLMGQVLVTLEKENLKPQKSKKMQNLPEEAYFDINKFILPFSDNINTSFPGFCILSGRCDLFRYLYESFTVSISLLEKTFEKINLTVLEILCIKGYHETLQFYLPLSLNLDPKKYLIPNSEVTYSFDFGGNTMNQDEILKSTYTPIHFAAFYGHIHCIRIIQAYFANKITPYWMDINFQDLITGENCALLACRSQNYSMIRYLFNSCNANFKILNSRKENALQILLCEAKKKPSNETLKIVKYLVENIGIDFVSASEEIFCVCEDPEIINYLEEKCAEQGLSLTKNSEDICEIFDTMKKQEEVSLNTDKSLSSFDHSHPSTIFYRRDSVISNYLAFLNENLKI